MSVALPDIEKIQALPQSVWTAFREQLRRAGFGAGNPGGLHEPVIGVQAESLQHPIALWHLRRRADVPANAFRMFVLGDAISVQQAYEVLSRNLMSDLLDAGLVHFVESDLIVSPFVLRVYRGFLVLSDDLAHRGNAVYGCGYGTRAFCARSSSHPARNVLEIGCGAGAVALWHSAHAEHVVATDVNPRALAFVKMNAALNRVANIEVREGNLLEPAHDETFDFITAQPPYVPFAPGLQPAAYLFAGPTGSEFISQLLSALPSHLTRTGRAMMVYEQPVMDDSCGRGQSIACGVIPAAHTLFIIGDEVGADAYSMRHAAPDLRTGIQAYDRVSTHMRAHLYKAGIRGMCPAICVMERADDACYWAETLPGGSNLWNDISSDAIDRLFKGQALMRQSADRGHAHAYIPPGSLLIHTIVDADGMEEILHLGLPPQSLVGTLELSRAEWEGLEAAQGGSSARLPDPLLAKLARAGLIH